MSHSDRSSAATYGRLLAYVRPYWKILAAGIAAGILVGIVSDMVLRRLR